MTRFPVGELRKHEVRAIAERHDLAVADKPDSADICFVPGGDYRAFVDQRLDPQPGLMVDADGAIIGRHQGVQHFTIGQRRGLHTGGGQRRYVVDLDAQSATVTLGGVDDLLVSTLEIDECHWLAEPLAHADRASVQLRYRSSPTPCAIEMRSNHTATVRLQDPVRAVAPGQAAAFYDADRVLGGGTIQRAT